MLLIIEIVFTRNNERYSLSTLSHIQDICISRFWKHRGKTTQYSINQSWLLINGHPAKWYRLNAIYVNTGMCGWNHCKSYLMLQNDFNHSSYQDTSRWNSQCLKAIMYMIQCHQNLHCSRIDIVIVLTLSHIHQFRCW